MKKLEAIAIGFALTFCVVGCAGSQTVEFNGCEFTLPSGQIDRLSDDTYLYEFYSNNEDFASLSWRYCDSYNFIDEQLDAGKIINTEEDEFVKSVKTESKESYLGAYKSLEYHEVKTYKDSGITPVVYNQIFRAQVHDNAYVEFVYTSTSENTFEKYMDEAEAVFESIELIR